MKDKETALADIKSMSDGDSYYFNMFQGGGALCCLCNGMYLLFHIPLHGDCEVYDSIYYNHELGILVDKAFSWT